MARIKYFFSEGVAPELPKNIYFYIIGRHRYGPYLKKQSGRWLDKDATEHVFELDKNENYIKKQDNNGNT